MTSTNAQPLARTPASELVELLETIPPGRRGAALQSAASFRPEPAPEVSFDVGQLRAAFANYWETTSGLPCPFEELRAVLAPPVPMRTVLAFSKLIVRNDASDIQLAVVQLIQHLQRRIKESVTTAQVHVFEGRRHRSAPERNPNPHRNEHRDGFGDPGHYVRDQKSTLTLSTNVESTEMETES